jgi:hypothetical protein
MHQRLRRRLQQALVADTNQPAEEGAVPCAPAVVFVANAAPVAAEVDCSVDVNREPGLDRKGEGVEDTALYCRDGGAPLAVNGSGH